MGHKLIGKRLALFVLVVVLAATGQSPHVSAQSISTDDTMPPNLPGTVLPPRSDSLWTWNTERLSQFGGSLGGLAVSGTTVWVGIGSELTSFDLNASGALRPVGRTTVSGLVSDIKVLGSTAYVLSRRSTAMLGGAVDIVDVSDPSNPQPVGFSGAWEGDGLLAVSERGVAVVTSSRDVIILDVSRPSAPRLVSHLQEAFPVDGMALRGTTLFLAMRNDLHVIDLTDPTTPHELMVLSLSHSAGPIIDLGDYLVVTATSSDRGSTAVDIRDPRNPVLSGPAINDYPGTPAVQSGPFAGRYTQGAALALLGDSASGVRRVSLSDPSNPVQVSNTPEPHGRGFASPGWVLAGSRAVVNVHDELHVYGLSDPTRLTEVASYIGVAPTGRVTAAGGLAFVTSFGRIDELDVSDPQHPTSLAHISVDASAVAYMDGRLYTNTNGLTIFDVSRPGDMQLLGGWSDETVSAIAVQGHFAYLLAGGGDLYIVDVSEPSAPHQVAALPTRSAQGNVLNGIVYAGGYVYATSRSGDVRIVDVRDPARPIQVGIYTSPSDGYGIARIGNVILAADSGGVKVIDVEQPNAPALITNIPVASNILAAWNSLLFVGSYSFGVLVYDLMDPRAPREVGFFQTTTAEPGIAVDGGEMYVADGAGGLQVVRFVERDAAPSILSPTGPRSADLPIWAYVHESITGYPKDRLTIGPDERVLPSGQWHQVRTVGLGQIELASTFQSGSDVFVPIDERVSLLRLGAAQAGSPAQTPWAGNDLGDYAIESLASDPTDDAVVYAAGLRADGHSGGGNFHRSQDGGRSWSSQGINSGYTGAYVIADSSGRVYGIFGGILYLSLDHGEQWRREINASGQVAVSPSDPDVRYVRGSVNSPSLMGSQDDGLTWQPVSELDACNRGPLLLDARSGEALLAGGTCGVQRSDDGGQTWRPLGGNGPDIVSYLAQNPSSPNQVFAGSVEDGLWRSDDDGETWQPLYRSGPVTAFAFDADTQILYLADPGIGVLRSPDAGESWESLDRPSQTDFHPMALLPMGSQLLMGTDHGVWIRGLASTH